MFDHDIHLKPITIDELFNKNNYKKVAKEKFEEDNEKLFDKLNLHNRGIIADKSLFLNIVKIKGGAEKITDYINYNEEIIIYCSNISTINKSGTDDKIYLESEDKFMQYYINEKIDDEYISIMPENLGKFILSNNKEKKNFLK